MNNPSQPLETLQSLLNLLASDPAKAADMLDDLADKLRCRARLLREKLNQPFRAPGGMVDVVKMRVIAPDGSLKQEIDTGHN